MESKYKSKQLLNFDAILRIINRNKKVGNVFKNVFRKKERKAAKREERRIALRSKNIHESYTHNIKTTRKI